MIPVFAFDHKRQKFVLFPYKELITLPDGTKGIKVLSSYPFYSLMLAPPSDILLGRFPDNFERVGFSDLDYTLYRYVPTSPKRKQEQVQVALARINKGPKWYSADKGQIKGYQWPRRNK